MTKLTVDSSGQLYQKNGTVSKSKFLQLCLLTLQKIVKVKSIF